MGYALEEITVKVSNVRVDVLIMSNIEIESRTARAVPLTISVFEPGISRAEQIDRIRAALEMLRGCAEE